MKTSILSTIAALVFLMPSASAASENSFDTEGFRIGAGLGIAQMSADVPGQSTYKANVPTYMLNLGYAFTPAWEAGVVVSGGANRDAFNGTNYVQFRMPGIPKAYLRGRYFSSGSLGAYGMLTLGLVKQYKSDLTGAITHRNRFIGLGGGAGVSWKVAPKYIIDAGFFIPGIPLSSRGSGLSTAAPGVMISFHYAFGDK